MADTHAAYRLDALLDLVAGAEIARPTALVVHVRADEPDTPDGRPAAWIEGGPSVPVSVAARMTCTVAAQAMVVDRRGGRPAG